MASPIVIELPPPPPPPPQKSGVELEQWYWEEGYRRGYLAARSESPMVRIKQWWQSRLIWLGSAAIAGGMVLEVLAAERQLALQAFGEYGPGIIIGLGIAVNWLRWKTTTGIQKAP